MLSASSFVSGRRWLASAAALTLTASGLYLGIQPALAASCQVNSNGDAHALSAAASCDTATPGVVTLRSALEHFSSTGGNNTITFSGPLTISLTNGALVDGDSGTLTITGAGIDQTVVDAHHASRIFDSASGPIVISGMTLKNGEGATGAVFFSTGDVTATSLKITGSVVNSANVFGGIVDGGTVSFTSSLIDGTTVTSTDGSVDGAIFDSGDVTLTDTLITNTNITVEPGNNLDGMFNSGDVHLLRSAIVGVTAAIGDRSTVDGGIFNSGDVTLDHSALGNYTLTAGATTTMFGGIFNSGTVTVLDSTIGHFRWSMTTGALVHGSIFSSGAVALTNATVADNILVMGANSANADGTFDSGPVTLKNAILSKNLPANCAGTVSSSDHSLDSDGTCGLGAANGNKSNQDPGLGAFQLNAPGTTQTMAIGATSPAYNSANNANCPSTDQRGVTRIFAGDPTCDMGAYEFVAVPTPTPSPTASVAPTLPKAGTPSAPSGPGLPVGWAALAGLLLGLPLAARPALRRGLSGRRQ